MQVDVRVRTEPGPDGAVGSIVPLRIEWREPPTDEAVHQALVRELGPRWAPDQSHQPPAAAAGRDGLAAWLLAANPGDLLDARGPLTDPPPGPRNSERLIVVYERGAAPRAIAWNLLTQPVVTIGRSSSADIVLDDPRCPRRGIELRAEPRPTARHTGSNGAEIRLDHDVELHCASAVILVTGPSESFDDGTLFEPTASFNERPERRSIRVPSPPTTNPRMSPPWITIGISASMVVMAVLSGVGWNSLWWYLISPLFIVGSVIEQRQSQRRSSADAAAAHRSRLSRAAAEISEQADAESAFLERVAPPSWHLEWMSRARSNGLWRRRTGDDDWGWFRLGHHTTALGATVETDDEVDPDDLRRIGAAQRRRTPLIWNASEDPALALVGEACALRRSILAQAMGLQPPSELWITLLSQAESSVAPMRYAPHVRRAEQAMGRPAVATSESDRLSALDALGRSIVGHDGPTILVVVDEPTAQERARLDELARDDDHGRLWILTTSATRAPRNAHAVLEVGGGAAPALWRTRGGEEAHPELEGLRTNAWRRTALYVAPLDDRARSEEDHALEPIAVTAAEVAARWADATDAHLRVQLGESSLCLVEDGPHMLVAGTTGSGKSEFVRSMLLALATSYGPDRLQLLLVDFKGGSAFTPLAELAHTVGVVTNLSGSLIERVLRSLEVELTRRMAAFAEVHADDLAAYNAAVDTPMPRLVVVIDEFAALVQSSPHGAPGLVEIARRGRSLGIHLILSTQRPHGVVSDEIRANVSIRAALRMTDPAESIDVIGVDDAAFISADRPGEALVRIAEPPLRRCRPSPVETVLDPDRAVVVARRLDRTPTRLTPVTGSGAPEATVLDAACESIAATWGEQRRPTAVWTDPLPDVLEAPSVGAERTPSTGWVTFGEIDAISIAGREPLQFGIGREHLLLIGRAGVGKSSTLMRVMSAVEDHPAAEVYVVDGGGDLAPAAALRCVANVVRPDDTELLARLCERVRSAPPDGVTRIVIVDDVERVLDTVDTPMSTLLTEEWERLARGAPARGAQLICSATRRGAIPPGLAAAVANRWVFDLADEDELASSCGLVAGALPDGGHLVAGRVALLGGWPHPHPRSAPPGPQFAQIFAPSPEPAAEPAPPHPARLLTLSDFARRNDPPPDAIGVDRNGALVRAESVGPSCLIVGSPGAGTTAAIDRLCAAALRAQPGGRRVHLGARAAGHDHAWTDQRDAFVEAVKTPSQNGWTVFSIDDLHTMIDEIGAAIAARLDERLSNGDVFIVGGDGARLSRFDPLLTLLLARGRGFVFAHNAARDAHLFDAAILRWEPVPARPGRGYLLAPNEPPRLVQLFQAPAAPGPRP